MKKRLMIILVAVFLVGNLGLNAQVVNTDIPTEEEVDEEEITPRNWAKTSLPSPTRRAMRKSSSSPRR